MKSFIFGAVLFWLMTMLYVFLDHHSGALKDEEFRVVIAFTCSLIALIVFALTDSEMKDRSDD